MDLKTLRESDEDVLILPGARVSGDVTFGSGCSVWYNAVIRGDAAPIAIGDNTNVQDNSTLHTSRNRPMVIGSDVSIGHNVVLHSCTIRDNCLIGLGALILDDAVIGENSIVGAGALVTKGTIVPPGSMVLGAPAKVKRPLTEAEIEDIRRNSRAYLEEKEQYR